MPSTDTRIDTNDEFIWTSISTTRDDDGDIIESTIVYDNGDTQERTFSSGIGFLNEIGDEDFFRTTTRNDISDTRIYEYQTIQHHIFPPGEAFPNDAIIITRSETLYDDGVLVQFARPVYGDETTSVSTDTADAHDWATITVRETGTSYFGNDLGFAFIVTATQTIYDDGRVENVQETPFSKQTTLLDADGEFLSISRLSFNEDGSVNQASGGSVGNVDYTIWYNEDGIVTAKDETDTGLDVRNFERRFTEYDDEGNWLFRGTLYDSGLFIEQNYEDGILATQTTTDETDILNYQTRTDTFDAEGALVQRATLFDNGLDRSETFVDGQRAQITTTDTLDVVSYESITIEYDLQNGLETRTTVQDNGRTIELYKQDGVNLVKVEIDGSEDGALYTYAARATIYDETGAIEQLRSDQDNGDRFIFNYADGTRTQRIEYDGNDSEDWTFKVTDYNAESAPAVNFYESFDDAPVEVYEDFGFAFTF